MTDLAHARARVDAGLNPLVHLGNKTNGKPRQFGLAVDKSVRRLTAPSRRLSLLPLSAMNSVPIASSSSADTPARHRFTFGRESGGAPVACAPSAPSASHRARGDAERRESQRGRLRADDAGLVRRRLRLPRSHPFPPHARLAPTRPADRRGDFPTREGDGAAPGGPGRTRTCNQTVMSGRL